MAWLPAALWECDSVPRDKTNANCVSGSVDRSHPEELVPRPWVRGLGEGAVWEELPLSGRHWNQIFTSTGAERAGADTGHE